MAVTHLGDNRLFTLQNAAFTFDDYVDFLTTYLSLVHVITPDDLVGTEGDPVVGPFISTYWLP